MLPNQGVHCSSKTLEQSDKFLVKLGIFNVPVKFVHFSVRDFPRPPGGEIFEICFLCLTILKRSDGVWEITRSLKNVE